MSNSNFCRILTYTSLMGLKLLLSDTMNVNLTLSSEEGCYITCGTVFDFNSIGKRVLTQRMPFRTKCVGRYDRNRIRDCMNHRVMSFAKQLIMISRRGMAKEIMEVTTISICYYMKMI